MLAGCFIHSVDEKCRISLPARLRRILPEAFVLTKGPDGCLWALADDAWNSIIDRPDLSPEIERFLVASAHECAPGDKGRFLIPDALRRHADIRPGDEVAIVGLRNRVEIWSVSRWQEAASRVSVEDIRRSLPELYPAATRQA